MIRLLAERGDAEAQAQLAKCYFKGLGVTEDPAEAVVWYRRAAEQGHAQAQNNLGRCLLSGLGVPKDPVKAAVWLMKAAQQGLAGAQHGLASCYATGNGVPKDKLLAYMWANLAAATGRDDSAQLRDGLEAGMTAAEVAEGQRLSREFHLAAQQQGWPPVRQVSADGAGDASPHA